MNSQPFEKPPRWWSPKLSPWWIKRWRRLRKLEQRRTHRLVEVNVQGAEHVQKSLADRCGVLITPNHPTHADAFALYEAADQVGCPFYVMVAWQVFQRSGLVKQLLLRHHGCFSVDREGMDMSALRKAREILQTDRCPLTIFPEGEVYHLNDRITSFREGPAAIALMAAKKAARPVVCIPCAMKFEYVEDPTEELLELMSRLESALFWRARPDLGLPERIYHLAEGLIALKEVEFLGRTQPGELPERITNLIEFLLGRIESAREIDPKDATLPERVKLARQATIKVLEELDEADPDRQSLYHDLDDLFLVVQAFSYPGNYVREQPSIEWIAESLDKFEEDVLGASTATIRGKRRATVTFGKPIQVTVEKPNRMSAAGLTTMLEERVQALLDGVSDNGSG